MLFTPPNKSGTFCIYYLNVEEVFYSSNLSLDKCVCYCHFSRFVVKVHLLQYIFFSYTIIAFYNTSWRGSMMNELRISINFDDTWKAIFMLF